MTCSSLCLSPVHLPPLPSLLTIHIHLPSTLQRLQSPHALPMRADSKDKSFVDCASYQGKHATHQKLSQIIVQGVFVFVQLQDLTCSALPWCKESSSKLVLPRIDCMHALPHIYFLNCIHDISTITHHTHTSLHAHTSPHTHTSPLTHHHSHTHHSHTPHHSHRATGPVTIEWLHGDNSIMSGSENNLQLHLPSVELGDAGEYMCRVTLSDGTVVGPSSAGTLTVLGMWGGVF